jgi:hypothetical protein
MIMSASTAPATRTICVSRMMERLGIGPGGSVVPRLGLRYATAIRRCRSCPSTRACREWLEQAPKDASLPPRFCPVSDILLELQFDQPGRGRGDLVASREGTDVIDE